MSEEPRIVSGPEVDRIHECFQAALAAAIEYLGSRLRTVEAERDCAIQQRDAARHELQALKQSEFA